MGKINFTAIDFETMTGERTSACAIGVARVVDGIIVEKYFSLLKPIPDDRTKNNALVNGITPEMVKNAPTFKEAWAQLQYLLDNQVLVAHNSDFDEDVLYKVCEYYGINCHVINFIDTYKLTALSLDKACTEMCLPLDSHHDALCDAVACAEIYIKINGGEIIVPPADIPGKRDKSKEIKGETKQPLNADEVENKNTSFFMKKVVLTGTLQSFPVREEVAELLKKYGADINSSISKKTQIVIVGAGAGPSKMKKIAELKEQGVDIKVWNETEFLHVLADEGIK